MNEVAKAKWGLAGYFVSIALGVATISALSNFMSYEASQSVDEEHRRKILIGAAMKKQFRVQAQEKIKSCEDLLNSQKKEILSDFKCQVDISVDANKARVAADAKLSKEKESADQYLNYAPGVNLTLCLFWVAAMGVALSGPIREKIKKIRGPEQN